MIRNEVNNHRGRTYAAPAVDVLEIVSEQIFAESLNWEKSLDWELEYGNENNKYQ